MLHFLFVMENKELVEIISEKLGRSKSDVGKLATALCDVIEERCGALDSVAVPGFGTFEGKKKDERVMVNPSNGKRMLVPPKITLNFKVSNVLKTRLKNNA